MILLEAAPTELANEISPESAAPPAPILTVILPPPVYAAVAKRVAQDRPHPLQHTSRARRSSENHAVGVAELPGPRPDDGRR
jgi:hypothetical protein